MAEYEDTVIETQPTEPENQNGRNWLRLIGMILAAIAVTILLIFAARWVYNTITDNDSRDGSVQPADEDKLPPGPGEEDRKSNDGSGSSETPNTGDRQPATQTPRAGTQLPNSGPGHIAAVFAGSSLAGAGIHYLISRRR